MKFIQVATNAVLECNNESVIAQMLKHPEAYTKVEDKKVVEAVEDTAETPKKAKKK